MKSKSLQNEAKRHPPETLLKYDFEESVGYWVGITTHVVRRALDVELAREGITLRQWEVLAWIAHDGELTQTQLAERLGIEAPTLAGVLSRMERDGWLARVSCPNDKRCKLIRATDKSEKLWNRMTTCCHRVREHAIQGISQEDLETLKRTCEAIRQNLDGWTN